MDSPRASGAWSSDARGVSTSTQGACLCGAVAFAIAPPYRWFAHCHCSLCRKHHGSLFGLGVGVARGKLEWRRGTDTIVHYRATAAFARPFCGDCGSTVPAVSHDERFWHVPAGLLDGDPGARPRSHIFVGSKSPLYELTDTLPRHAAYPPEIALPTVEPRATPADSDTITGSCVCDRIAFSVTGVPRRVVNCYCSLCRRRSGSAFTSTLLTTADRFRWLRGEARVRHYALPATLEVPEGGRHANIRAIFAPIAAAPCRASPPVNRASCYRPARSTPSCHGCPPCISTWDRRRLGASLPTLGRSSRSYRHRSGSRIFFSRLLLQHER